MARINAVSFHENPSIEAICAAIKESGFDSIEMSRPPFYQKLTTPGLRKRFAEWSTALGLTFYGFDCWVDVQPFGNRGGTIEEFGHAIDWAVDLNLGMIISHDSWTSVNAGRSSVECLSENLSLFRVVARECIANGLTLVFEPHPDTLSMNNQWAIDFIDGIADGLPEGSVGLVYDCCHYGVGQPEGYLESIGKLGKRIRHVHFSDGDMETYALHLPLGDGKLDLLGIVAALKGIGFNGTLTNDLFNYPLLADGARRNCPEIRSVEAELGLRP